MMDTFEELTRLLAKSGFVGVPLVIGAIVLWFGLGYRLILLFFGDRRDARALAKAALDDQLTAPRGVLAAAAHEAATLARRPVKSLRRVLDETFFGYEQELRKFGPLTSSIVRIAPLLGLLGTVSGMIETFDHLGDSGGLNQGAGVAGGISEALFSTQMGLMVAIPGLLIGRLLDRKAEVVGGELEKLKEVFAQLDRQDSTGEVAS